MGIGGVGMNHTNNYNLTINGSGSSGGGSFNKARIRGEGTITDHFQCNSFKSHGSCEILGNMKVGAMDVFGSAELRKNLQGNEVKIIGAANISGNVEAKSTKIRGTIDIGGNLAGDMINVKGGLNVKGDCEVESFVLNGVFEINGIINAGNIDISLKWATSKVKEIGGEKINIHRNKSLFSFPFNKAPGELVAELIEGDEIYIEYSKVAVVRGNEVEIGPGCEIGLVEYKKSFKQAKESTIKEYKQI